MEEEIRDNLDNREWSEKHLEAAGRLPKPSIAALTPPHLDHVDGRDVDVRGPDGFTPLMIASFCGSRAQRQSTAGPDSDSTGSTDLDTEDTTAIISDLISQGAAVNATTDRTGESAAAKCLLGEGTWADCFSSKIAKRFLIFKMRGWLKFHYLAPKFWGISHISVTPQLAPFY